MASPYRQKAMVQIQYEMKLLKSVILLNIEYEIFLKV